MGIGGTTGILATSPATSADVSLSETIRRRPLLALFLLSLLMAMAFQGSRGLWDPDEGRYTNVSLQMLRSGDPITLYRHHDSYHFTKPPVTYWAMAASMKAFGRNEWAVRLPMALAFVLSTLLVYRLGRTFVPDKPWLPALIYLSAPFPYFASNTINTDTLLAATETLAVLCYVQARFAGGSPRWLDGMWAAFGLAFMTKGPPALLPLLAIFVFQFSQRGGPRLFRPWGLLAFAAIGLTWFVLVIQLHPGLLEYFLGREVVARIASDELDRHPQWYGPLQIYLPTLLFGLLPWAPMALWKKRGFLRPHWPSAPPELRFLWLWVAVPLLIFCLARSRLPLYLLPLAAPLALLMGRALAPMPVARASIWLFGAWLLLLVAMKGVVAHDPPGNSELALGMRKNNAANLAAQIQPLLPGKPEEIIFVEDKTRYGLHLYLGAEIERVSFKPHFKSISDANFDKTLAESLRETHGGRVYFFKRPNDVYFLNEVRAADRQPVLLGVLHDPKERDDQDRMIYTLAGDFPGQGK